MTLQFWFWVFMALYLFFGVWRGSNSPEPRYYIGGHVLHVVLLLILGWGVFGAPVK